MKRYWWQLALASILLIGLLIVNLIQDRPTGPVSTAGIQSVEASEGTRDNPLARLEYEWLRLHDPATGLIPEGIAQHELEFARQLAQHTGARPVTADDIWTARGPHNIGGRTSAVALDVKDENVILAGAVSSGMFKSTDGGTSWTKTTAPDQLHSVSAIAQNKAPGYENIWYYGTGSRSPGKGSGEVNSAIGLLGTNSFYRGDGVFKSTDNGDTWSLLESTESGSPEETDVFDFVWSLVTFGEDGVLAATSSGLFKSMDGGASWTHPLNFGEFYPSTEIAMTSDGAFYATVGGEGPDNGVYRSLDGDAWENISPDGWPGATVRTVLDVAASNENVVYFFSEVAHLEQRLWMYEHGAGWTDLTSGLPFNAQMATFGGKMLVIDVKPDDQNTLFLGAINLFRSTDGGASFEDISIDGANFHVDQQTMVFYPSDPGRMIVGNDGGLYRTENNIAEAVNQTIDWDPLNNGYVTTQFYTVAIDHGTVGSETVIGGTQDNGIVQTSSSDPEAPWQILHGGDGAYTAISDGGEYLYYTNGATFTLFRHSFPAGGEERTDVRPTGGRLGVWLTKFMLDPHDQRMMYLPSRRTLWRNSDLTAIPHQQGGGPTDLNWDVLENVTEHYIHALGMSEAEPRRLYYSASWDSAGANERLFRLDNPHEGQPVPVEITGEDFPFYPFSPYINCIAVDPRDADNVIVAFPSYGVISMYASEDGGENWAPVSGNLEENPDGTGHGPSVRWVEILYLQDEPVYLAGTSVGLFSARGLDGMNTLWSPEAQETIGNVVVDMIDVRQSDGFTAVATHGNGIYTAYVNEVATSIDEVASIPETLGLYSAYPNPFSVSTTVSYQLAEPEMVNASVYDIRGRKIATLHDGRQMPGTQVLHWNAGNASDGVYFIRTRSENTIRVVKVVVQR